MNRVAAIIVASLACAACAAAGPMQPSQPMLVHPGQPFSLQAGQSAQAAQAAQAAGGAWQVGFEGVTSDSRCPRGVQCVWAGDATVRIWWRRGAGSQQQGELHLGGGLRHGSGGEVPTAAARPGPRLVALDPYPTAGRDMAQQDYVATLVWTDGADGAVEK